MFTNCTFHTLGQHPGDQLLQIATLIFFSAKSCSLQTWHNIKFLFNININIFKNLVFKININIKILQKTSSISKSISISKFSHPQYQNQYQNFSKPRINIKININIVKILVLILKIKIFGGLKIWFLTSSDLFLLEPLGYHLIPIAPKHGTLGPSLGPKRDPTRHPW